MSRTVVLILVGLGCATLGDTLSQLNPGAVQQISAAFFLLALIFYAATLLPLWNRNRDPMRIALAIPYGGVVIGLFVADRKSTRLNSSHVSISYAVFCLKKKTM